MTGGVGVKGDFRKKQDRRGNWCFARVLGGVACKKATSFFCWVWCFCVVLLLPLLLFVGSAAVAGRGETV